MGSFVRISSLLWADILVAYALFVMQNYLTQVWDLSFTHAAGILNLWNGIAMALPALVIFFRDACLANRNVLMFSSLAYCVGMGFVTLSVPSVLANPCDQLDSRCVGRSQKALFYTGMSLIAVGMAGNQVSLLPFLAHQTGDPQMANGQTGNPTTDVSNFTLLQVLGLILVVIVAIVGAIGLPYVKPWKIRFGIPAICATFAAILFFTGFLPCCKYKKDVAQGSPVTKICRVFMACFCNISVERPLGNQQHHMNAGALQSFKPTRCLRCLEKAVIVQQGTNEQNITSAEVEDAKIAVRMVPMWLTFIICGLVSSIGNTYFVEQANNLDRHLGKWNVPLPILLFFRDGAKYFISAVAAYIVESSKPTRPPKGIAVAMVFSILCCITAAKIEQRRLDVVRKHDLLDKPDADIPMSIYWLLFQFFLLAGVDAFFEKSVNEFYRNEAPDLMKEYLLYLTKGVFGLGYMSNVLSVFVVGKISAKGGKKPNWFQKTLNKSRLDKYYWVLSVMSTVNLLVFWVVASCYRYKNGDRPVGGPDAGMDGMPQEDAPEQNAEDNGEQ